MATLHIEHPITDFDGWREAYRRFAAHRRSAGAFTERVSRPINDPNYVINELDLQTTDQAARSSCRTIGGVV